MSTDNQPRAASDSANMPSINLVNPYIPYLIAAAFVVMTAILTLLLTMVLDNHAEIEDAVKEHDAQILVAKTLENTGIDTIASRQLEVIETPVEIALNDEDIVAPVTEKAPTTSTASPVQSLVSDETLAISTESQTSAADGMKQTAPPSLAKSAPTISPETNTEATLSNATVALRTESKTALTDNVEQPAPAEIDMASETLVATDEIDATPASTELQATVVQELTVAANTEATTATDQASNDAENIAQAVNAINSAQDTVAGEAKTSKNKNSTSVATNTSADNNVTKVAIAQPSQQLTRIVTYHQKQIHDIQNMMATRAQDQRMQFETLITNQLLAMNHQIQHLEESVRPQDPFAQSWYDNMLKARRDAFNRMIEQRQQFLNKLQKSRETLRQRYTQLLQQLKQLPA